MRNDIVSMRVDSEKSAGDSKTFSEINCWQPLAQCGYCPKCHYFKYLKDGICEQCRKDKNESIRTTKNPERKRAKTDDGFCL